MQDTEPKPMEHFETILLMDRAANSKQLYTIQKQEKDNQKSTKRKPYQITKHKVFNEQKQKKNYRNVFHNVKPREKRQNVERFYDYSLEGKATKSAMRSSAAWTTS